MAFENMRFFRCLGVGSWILLSGVAACAGRVDDPIGSTSQAVTATFTISGTVTDSSGNPIAALVALTGSHQEVTSADRFTGAYSFTVPAGSYSLSASTQCLAFVPNVANLNDLHANTVVDFVGSGNDPITNCEPATSAGATSGTLTIHGVVTSAGHPVAGAKVVLNGSTQGFRFSDETGAYTFSVNRGSYSVSASGACRSYAPSVANLNNVAASQTVNFSGSGNCPPAPLGLCPTFDAAFGIASLGDVCSPTITTSACSDRSLWTSAILEDSPALNGSDCRFAKLGSLFSATDLSEYLFQLTNFIDYISGCPIIGTEPGPLTDVLVPPFLLARGARFTTADVQALSDDFVLGVQQALSDAGAPPLTAAQLSALEATLTYLQGNLAGITASSTLTYASCP